VKLVLDTNVVVSALRQRAGASAEVVRRVLRGELAAAASTALHLEYEAVVTRPEHLRAAGFTHADILVVLDALAAAMAEAPIWWRLRPMSPDPGDDLVIEAAFNAGADKVVTSNERDLAKPCSVLGIRTVTPHMLLLELRRGP
jgi:putative PIN family toxin of toxin-antitoxin system